MLVLNAQIKQTTVISPGSGIIESHRFKGALTRKDSHTLAVASLIPQRHALTILASVKTRLEAMKTMSMVGDADPNTSMPAAIPSFTKISSMITR